MAPLSPLPQPWCPIPILNIEIRDLGHKGYQIFRDAVPDPAAALREAVTASFIYLYTEDEHPKNVESITLILRAMDGVAHTCGSHTEKQIHFSFGHIVNSAHRARDEIMGVLVHEVVHCFQYNAKGTCPGGLIEGVADYVRLKAGYNPPHWKPKVADKWDAGYDSTAYFLNWIETRYGDGTIRELNKAMHDKQYTKEIFVEITGRRVNKLWNKYCSEISS